MFSELYKPCSHPDQWEVGNNKSNNTIVLYHHILQFILHNRLQLINSMDALKDSSRGKYPRNPTFSVAKAHAASSSAVDTCHKTTLSNPLFHSFHILKSDSRAAARGGIIRNAASVVNAHKQVNLCHWLLDLTHEKEGSRLIY